MSYGSAGTIVGAVIGSVVPGIGTAAGAAIGGALGGIIDQNQIPDNKLDDLKAAKVTLGAPINLLFGHPRSGGNIVWCSEAIEAGEEGAKGGGPTTTYYVRNVLLKLSEDKCGPITRIWFAGKLVYNVLSTADDETIEASVTDGKIAEVIYYSGSDEQLPDPTYAQAVGDENAPAYRGCSTAALIGIACGSSGQLPLITVEVAGKEAGDNAGRTVRIKEDWAEADVRGEPPEGASMGGLAVIGLTEDGVQTYRDADTTAVDTIPVGAPFSIPAEGNGDIALAAWGTSDGICRLFWAGSGHSISIECEEVNDYLGSSELRFSTFDGEIAFGSSLAFETGLGIYGGCLGTQGRVYIHALNGDHVYTHQFYPTVAKADSLALNGTTLWILDGSSVYEYSREDYLLKATISVPSGSGHRIFISQEGALCIANSSAQIWRWEQGETDLEWTLLAALDDALDDNDDPIPATYLGTSNAHHMVRSGSVYAVVRKQRELSEPTQFVFYVNPGWSGGTIDPSYGFNSIGEIAYKFAYVDGSLFHGDLVGWAFSFSYADGSYRRASRFDGYEIVSETPFPGGPAEFQPMSEITLKFNASRLYGYAGDSGQPPGMYPTSFNVVIYKAVATIEDISPKWYVDVYRKRLNVDTYDLTEPTLQEVVEALCVRADLPLEKIDATALAVKKVRALAVSQVGPTSSTLELLMVVYKFFCTESGGKLVFKFFGDAPVRTLSYGDLGASFGDPPVNALPIIRGSELELPSMESARYANVDNDYQDGLESSDRLNASTQSATVSEYAIGLTPDEAKRLVVTNQQIRVAGLRRFDAFNVGPENRELEPGDSILVGDDKDNVFQMFIQKAAYDRGVITLEGMTEDTSAYTSDAKTANDYTNSTTVRPPPETSFEILDVPLLSDESDVPHFHVVAKPERLPWPGYSFQKSPDNNSFTEIYQDNSIGVFGVCTTTLAQWSGGNVVDWRSTITVDVGAGQLSSITRTDLLSGRANLAMVGNEMLQYQTAELVTSGVYILSGLVRYLGGTEWVGHGPGERFVLLKQSTLETVNINLADAGVVRYYRAVTLGRNPNTAASKTFAPELVSKKPVAPANLRLIDLTNGDLLLRWTRRTRYQSNSLRGIVPLGESTEAYTVEIYDGPTLLRTISVTTNEATYSAAQQSADGVDSGTDLIIRVRQVGDLQGYASTVTQDY